MIVISANNLSKSFGVDEIFSGLSFSVNKGDRIGIIGANGVGKSTLFNILSGSETYDEGSFFISSDLKVGYFRQNDLLTSEKTVYEEMLSIFADVIKIESEMETLAHEIALLSENGSQADASPNQGNFSDNGAPDQGRSVDKLLAEYDRLSETFKAKNGYSYKSEISGILNSMAFPPSFFDKKTSLLSGGERTRLALAALLLRKPDILMLDEPTNHLDIGTLKWLEQYIHSYEGTVLLISHDRYFIDHTVNRIFDIENHRLSVYEGNYTFYASEKKLRYENEMRAYTKQSEEIARQEDMIRRFKERGTEKLAKRAKSREKALSKTERLDKPLEVTSKMKIQFKESSKSGNDTLQAFELSKSFGSGNEKRTLFTDVSFDIKRGERICIIGPNGTGKTTLLKIIMSQLSPSSGHIKIGHNVVFGYYDQEQSLLNDSASVIEEMRDSYGLYSDTELRGLLGRFLFQNDDVFKLVSSLSGGERARLALLKLMLSGSNVLILDEPTNHLDIPSKEVFEDALIDFPGTSIIVSHDRYLLNKVPTKIFELTHDGITSFPGNYDYYNEKKASISSASAYLNELGKKASSASDEDSKPPASDKAQRLEERRKSKELQTQQRRKERLIASLEEKISQLEDEISELKEEMCKEEYMTDHTKLAELSESLARKQDELDMTYEEWASHSDE